jgi:hypothetical protein
MYKHLEILNDGKCLMRCIRQGMDIYIADEVILSLFVLFKNSFFSFNFKSLVFAKIKEYSHICTPDGRCRNIFGDLVAIEQAGCGYLVTIPRKYIHYIYTI